ncbi:peptidylprolyl isomerase [Neptunitalea chrysea]|uniref:Trigger factor n=1 Tax=Neptunitalea chrysea TaxID=1647581 RepID=A0A9W6B2E1_9FLAO|nr:trigger factor [Neptunitalea chrysea]GLB51046.1 peptidylprolyl isomerase [Neptunitalea chrysea]
MNITKEQVDDLNAIVTVALSKEDYSDKVDSTLDNYRKTADIPGFRKGHVPMGMVKKQYGKAVLVDEVNKLLQEALNNFLTEEKLDVLGNPLPKPQDELDWDAEELLFQFELGLAPTFDIEFGKDAVTHYKVVADDKMLDEQIERIQKQFGKLVGQKEVIKDAEITATFVNEEKEINNKATFTFDKIKSEEAAEKLLGTKIGETVALSTNGLFADDHDLMEVLKVSHDDAHGLDIEVTATIEEVNTRELAELNQELFDKLFGEGVVTTLEEVKAKIKEDAEKQFVQQSDQKLLNDVTEGLIGNTSFDLPAEFLIKWLQASGEQPLTEEQAKEEYEKAEKGLRYQLIEGKIIKDNDLQVTFDELKDFAKDYIKIQMAQFGQLDPADEEVENVAMRIMSNQEEVKRLSEQLMSQKMITFFKDNGNLTEKEVSYEDFVKEAYS